MPGMSQSHTGSGSKSKARQKDNMNFPSIPSTVEDASCSSDETTMEVDEGSPAPSPAPPKATRPQFPQYYQPISPARPVSVGVMSADNCDITKVANTVEVQSLVQNVIPIKGEDQEEPHIKLNKGRIDLADGLEEIIPDKEKQQIYEIIKKACKTKDSNKTPSESKIETAEDLNHLLRLDPEKIPVKKLRVVIPKLRMKCYFRRDEIAGKRKMKHLWDEKPTDWPAVVPFLDPNNGEKAEDGGKKVPKPGKTQLLSMYLYLRHKYFETFGHPDKQHHVQMAPPHNAMYSHYTPPPQPHLVQPVQEAHRPPPRVTKPEPVSSPIPVQSPRPEVAQYEGKDVLEETFERVKAKKDYVALVLQQWPEMVLKIADAYSDVVEQQASNCKPAMICVLINALHEFEAMLDKLLVYPRYGLEINMKQFIEAFDAFIGTYKATARVKEEPLDDQEEAAGANYTNGVEVRAYIARYGSDGPYREIYGDKLTNKILDMASPAPDICKPETKNETVNFHNEDDVQSQCEQFKDLGIRTVGDLHEVLKDLSKTSVLEQRPATSSLMSDSESKWPQSKETTIGDELKSDDYNWHMLKTLEVSRPLEGFMDDDEPLKPSEGKVTMPDINFHESVLEEILNYAEECQKEATTPTTGQQGSIETTEHYSNPMQSTSEDTAAPTICIGIGSTRWPNGSYIPSVSQQLELGANDAVTYAPMDFTEDDGQHEKWDSAYGIGNS